MSVARRALVRPRFAAVLGVVLAAALGASGTAEAQTPPLPKNKKTQPQKKKKTDLEVDPDAKKEPAPLPPVEPGQWGVGGKEEEGQYAPGGQKDKDKKDKEKKDGDKDKEPGPDADKDKEKKDGDKDKEGEATPKPTAPRPYWIPPPRAFSVDFVLGAGSIDNPTDNVGKNGGQTKVTSISFIGAFSWRFADIWDVGVRFPFSQANLTGPLASGLDSAQTFAAGNFEVSVNPAFPISPSLRIPALAALTLPTAQGDLLGTISGGYVDPNQANVNLAAAAARGWEEMPLFMPHRFGIRLASGVLYDTDTIHVSATTGFDMMFRVGGNDAGSGEGFGNPSNAGVQVRGFNYAWLTRAAFHYSLAVGPGYIEPGLRAWLAVASLPWFSTSADDSGAQFVVEPAVDARFLFGEEKGVGLKVGIGGIFPVKGPLGGANNSSANIDGFRTHAEIQF